MGSIGLHRQVSGSMRPMPRVEITETMVMEDERRVVGVLQDLSALGCE
jgi:EAL domain-containing protein (putative c-di-GMP-specific phosphodiesterase class I)